MGKLIVLEIYGDFEHGFAVCLEIHPDSNYPATPKILKGKLSKNPDLLNQYRQWQSLYRNLETLYRPLKDKPGQVTNYSQKPEAFAACKQAAELLEKSMNTWLKSENKFRSIENELCEQLKSSKSVRVVLRTYYSWLQRLPWHLWDLPVESKPEIILSVPCSESIVKKIAPPVCKDKVKILAIFGSGIESQSDRQALECLANVAEINFLEQPPLQELNDRLWEQGWDILFFAGHSSSQSDGQQGEIQINEAYSLTIGDLRYALKKATEKGLRLAIFNSCDGLGLAYQLAEEKAIHLPFIIVMREPVPDEVAPKFLRYFLEEYAKNGAALDTALRDARQRLHGLEKDFPCASWLPVICQSTEEVPLTWQELLKGNDAARPRKFSWRSLSTAIALATISTFLVIGVRSLGILQMWELYALNQLMQLRADKVNKVPRLLIVEVTEADLQTRREDPISDRTLNQVLSKLEQYQPRAIGLDILRDFPIDPGHNELIVHLKQSSRIIVSCKNPTAQQPGNPPPPGISPDRIGFIDVALDPDKVVRRSLLAMTPPANSNWDAPYSLSFQVARLYLKQQGIEFPDTRYLTLGTTVFTPIEKDAGGYQHIDARGHQILLNYRSLPAIADRVTLTQVLQGNINPNRVKNRIVLIGYTAESKGDVFQTPLSEMPGVAIHAQVVNYILSVVLDRQPLLWFWPEWAETLWVWGSSLIGGILIWGIKHSWHRILAGGTILLVLCSFSFGIFIQGGWIPLVPSVLALLTASGSVTFYTAFRPRLWSLEK